MPKGDTVQQIKSNGIRRTHWGPSLMEHRKRGNDEVPNDYVRDKPAPPQSSSGPRFDPNEVIDRQEAIAAFKAYEETAEHVQTLRRWGIYAVLDKNGAVREVPR